MIERIFQTSNTRADRRRRYRLKLTQWKTIANPLASYVGPDVDIQFWHRRYRKLCRRMSAHNEPFWPSDVMDSIVSVIFGVAAGSLVFRIAIHTLDAYGVKSTLSPTDSVAIIVVLITVWTPISGLTRTLEDTSAISFTNFITALATIMTVAIQPSIDESTIARSLTPPAIIYISTLAFIGGKTAGKYVTAQHVRFGLFAAFNIELIHILSNIDDQGVVLADSHHRRDLLRHIQRAADYIEYGAGSSLDTYTQVRSDVQLHFKEAAEYIRSLSSWVAAPQETTVRDLKSSVASILAASISARFHYLPRVAIQPPLQPSVRTAIFHTGKRLAATATPAAVLLIADRFGLLPEGLRGWLLTVSLLGLAIGTALELSPHGLRSIRSAASLVASQSKEPTTKK